MTKFITAAALALSLAALPALAATTTVEFASSSGMTVVAEFSDEGTVSFNGAPPVAFTMDEEARTICSNVNGMDDCATFDEWSTELGHTSPYTTESGDIGTATVTAKAE